MSILDDHERMTRLLGDRSASLLKETLQDWRSTPDVIPEGSIVVDRARFERLLATAEVAFHARYSISGAPELAGVVFKHQHGDFDPLP